jgi:replicative DNA helicase
VSEAKAKLASIGADARAKKLAAEKAANDVPPLRIPRKLSEILETSIVRAERRAALVEKPIYLPWQILAEHFGGGLWPGVHYLTSGTGVGKTAGALQIALHAAKADTPVCYVGLEMGELDIALRLLAEQSGNVAWSHLWTGKATPAQVARVRRDAKPALEKLPIYFEVAKPNGYPPSELRAALGGLRSIYPEADGPGSRPMLVIVDFLQLIGDEPGETADLRVRVGRVAYMLRELSSSLGLAVLCISSAARDKKFSDVHRDAKLSWDEEDGYPINRRIGLPDAIVGFGKESGEIEYSGDSVSILAKVPATDDANGVDVIFATAKGRATGAMWSPLHFTGFRYEECSDGGARILEAWAEESIRRDRVREEKRDAKEAARGAKVEADADAIMAYVRANPGCTVRAARVNAVGDSSRRWNPAFAKVESFVRQDKTGRSVLLSLHEP